MNKKSTYLLFFILVSNFFLYSQDSILSGPFGGDLRIRPSYGGFPDLRYNALLKIKDLNSKKIAIGVSFPEIITITKKDFWGAKSVDYPYRFKIENFINTLIYTSPTQSKYNFRFFEKTDIERLKIQNNIWDGTLRISDKTDLKRLVEKYDADYLILIKGAPNPYFRSVGNVGVQGLYGYTNIFMIYAGNEISVFNLKTGKQMHNGYSPQVSADILPIKINKDFNDLTENELKIIDKIMELRLRNNLHQTFKLLGIE